MFRLVELQQCIDGRFPDLLKLGDRLVDALPGRCLHTSSGLGNLEELITGEPTRRRNCRERLHRTPIRHRLQVSELLN